MLYLNTVILIPAISPVNAFVSEFHSLSFRCARSLGLYVDLYLKEAAFVTKRLQIGKWLFMPVFPNMWTHILFSARLQCLHYFFI